MRRGEPRLPSQGETTGKIRQMARRRTSARSFAIRRPRRRHSHRCAPPPRRRLPSPTFSIKAVCPKGDGERAPARLLLGAEIGGGTGGKDQRRWAQRSTYSAWTRRRRGRSPQPTATQRIPSDALMASRLDVSAPPAAKPTPCRRREQAACVGADLFAQPPKGWRWYVGTPSGGVAGCIPAMGGGAGRAGRRRHAGVRRDGVRRRYVQAGHGCDGRLLRQRQQQPSDAAAAATHRPVRRPVRPGQIIVQLLCERRSCDERGAHRAGELRGGGGVYAAPTHTRVRSTVTARMDRSTS